MLRRLRACSGLRANGETMDLDAPPPGEARPAKASLFARAPKPPPPPPREPKKKRGRGFGLSQLSAFLSFVLVGVFVGLGGFVAVLLAERRVGPLAEEKTIVLTREDDDGPIADQLQKAGVISSSTLFSMMALLDGQRSALKRGEYKFPAGISMREDPSQTLCVDVAIGNPIRRRSEQRGYPPGQERAEIDRHHIGARREDQGDEGATREAARGECRLHRAGTRPQRARCDR